MPKHVSPADFHRIMYAGQAERVRALLRNRENGKKSTGIVYSSEWFFFYGQ